MVVPEGPLVQERLELLQRVRAVSLDPVAVVPARRPPVGKVVQPRVPTRPVELEVRR
jgi:hypothetical protein